MDTLKITNNNKKESAVLLPMDEWKAIQETLHLCLIPGMKDSIVSGMKEKLCDCSTEVEF
jgi:antitoxin YefM